MTFKPPQFFSEVACVMGADYVLGALFSSYFNDQNKYLPMFYFPGNEGVAEEHEESITSKIVTQYNQISITNRILQLKPQYVILLGLTPEENKLFSNFEAEIITINKAEELEEKLNFLNRTFNGDLRCNKQSIFKGLLLAKYQNKRLVVDETVSRFVDKSTVSGRSEGIVIIEKNFDIDNLFAANYAFSINADVFEVQEVTEEEKDLTKRELVKWGKEHNVKDYRAIIDRIKKRIGRIDFGTYAYATFFTEGLPYGFCLDNKIPTSHILKHGTCYSIFDAIYKELFDEYFYSSFIFSPGFFGSDDETKKIAEIFKTNNYFVDLLQDKMATVETFNNFAALLPYDIMHISSHGGETGGYYVIKKFNDRKGVEHKVEYYEIVGFSYSDRTNDQGEPLIGVTTKSIFKKFDGFAWKSLALKKQNIPRYVWIDMEKALMDHTEDEKNLIRVRANFFIPTSCMIQCVEGIHQGMFYYLAGQTAPFIFNNSCCSWYDIAYSLMSAGAISYVGTLWAIKNTTAKISAEYFYEENFKDDYSLMEVTFKTNLNINYLNDKNIYIFWGFPFSKLKRHGKKPEEIFKKLNNHLKNHFFELLKKIAIRDNTLGVRSNSFDMAKFILNYVHGKLKTVDDKVFNDYKNLLNEMGIEKERQERGYQKPTGIMSEIDDLGVV